MLAKSKLKSIEVLISKALIDSVISHDEFILINNVLKEYNDIKEDLIKFIKDFSLFIKQCYRILKYRKNTESKNKKIAKTKNGRIMLFSKSAVCDSKKSKFIKQEEAK